MTVSSAPVAWKSHRATISTASETSPIAAACSSICYREVMETAEVVVEPAVDRVQGEQLGFERCAGSLVERQHLGRPPADAPVDRAAQLVERQR